MSADVAVAAFAVVLAVIGSVLVLLVTPSVSSPDPDKSVPEDHSDLQTIDWRYYLTDISESHWL